MRGGPESGRSGLEVPGDVDYDDALVSSDEEQEFEELGSLVVEGSLPPVFDDQFGDEDGDLTVGVVMFDFEDVFDEGDEDEAVG